MKVHYSTEKHTWETPQGFFDKINEIFCFDIDVCAEHETAKVGKYFTIDDDALTKDWIGKVWCNPPYGREQIKFIEKACSESKKHGSIIVMLIPARPETKVWQNIIFKEATQVCFIKGRLKFGNSENSAPFPSAIVVFGGNYVDLSKIGHTV